MRLGRRRSLYEKDIPVPLMTNPSLSPRRSGLLLVLTLTFGGLAMGCGPSPSDVCQKTFDLVKAESGEAAAKAAIGGDMGSCVSKEEMRKDMQGLVKYKENNKCLMDAKTFKEVAACSK
jgi:hypothetical protein